MDEFLDEYAAAWNAVLADWKRYAADGTLDEKTLNRNVASASAMDQEFDTERVDELTEACYSAESISAETRSEDDA
jgi:hypothetical protein